MIKRLLILCAVTFLARPAFAVPEPVTDLQVAAAGFRHAALTWTAPYDVAAATTPAYYEIRLSTTTSFLNDTDWDSNSGTTAYPYRVILTTSGITAGQAQSLEVTGLVNSQTCFFAVKSSTDNIHWSSMSVTRPFATPVNTPPAVVGGHNPAYTGGALVPVTAPTLSWTVPVPGFNGTANTHDELYGDRITSFTVDISRYDDFSLKTVIEGLAAASWTTYALDENTTYYWRVKAWDAENLTSPQPPAVKNFIVNAVNEPPHAFALASPANGAIVTGVPMLQWTTAADPDPGDLVSYTVQYSTSPDFSVLTTTAVTGIAGTQYQPPDDLIENATYYWNVSAIDAGGLAVNSSTGSFRVNVDQGEWPAAFSAVSPADAAMVRCSTPTLSWETSYDPDPGDTVTYQIVSSTSDETLFNYPDVIDGIATTSYVMPPLMEDTTYWWRAVAVDVNHTWENAQTAIRSFYVNAINNPPLSFSLIAASGTVASATPLFSWQAADEPEGDGVSYRVEYSTDAGFNVVSSSEGLPGTSYTPAAPLVENATYYWRVAAIDSLGALRFSSETWELVIDAVADAPGDPAPLSPAEGAYAGLSPAFDWADAVDPDPGDRLAGYTLYYSTDFSVSTTTVAGIMVSSYTLAGPLANNTTYFWKVEAIAAVSGRTMSAPSRFVTLNRPPDAFSLLASSGMLHTASTLLDWQDAPDPEGESVSYTVVVATCADFSVAASSSGLAPSQYPLSGLSMGRSYYWYVEAADPYGNIRHSSETWQFTDGNQPPGAFALTPLPAIVASSAVDLAWGAAADPEGDPVTYTVEYSTAPDFSVRNSSAGIAGLVLPVNALAENAVYYWRVQATDNWGDAGAVTAAQHFAVNTTSEPPSAVILQSPADGAVNVSRTPLLTWQGGNDPDPGDTATYTLWYSSDPAFSTKTVVDLSTASYRVPADLQEYTLHYWKVIARDSENFSTESATGSFRTAKDIRPVAPANVRAALSADGKRATLSWEAVTGADDGTPLSNLAGYKVYRSNDPAVLFSVAPATAVAASALSWTDAGIAGQTVYYLVRAFDLNGVDGAPSLAQQVNGTVETVVFDDGQDVMVAYPPAILPSTVTLAVVRIPGDEHGAVLRSFRLSARDGSGNGIALAFAQPCTLTFMLPAGGSAARRAPATSAESVFWHNGVAWVNLGGQRGGEALTVQASATGLYQVRAVRRAGDAAVLNVWPKTITPNGDGINDSFNITLDNPASLPAQGSIFDVTGTRVSPLAATTDAWFTWDGATADGTIAAPGVYLYQLTCGGRTVNGTVVVAR